MAADARRPYHVGVAVGLTTGAYALALLAVTQVQAERDTALVEERAPAAQAIKLLDAHHDRMTTQLAQARERYLAGAAVYNDLVGQLADVDQGIANLDNTLAQIEAMGAVLPGFPSGPVAVANNGGTTKEKGATTAPALAPPPAAAPPPPVSASTGASGG
jgi:hypothetical protein